MDTDQFNTRFEISIISALCNIAIFNHRLYELFLFFNCSLFIGKREDDLCLEVVVLLGTAACDEACAMLLCKADILLSLIELLKAKQEDDEIVLQIIFVFYQVLRHESTREYLTKETGMILKYHFYWICLYVQHIIESVVIYKIL